MKTLDTYQGCDDGYKNKVKDSKEFLAYFEKIERGL
jgi:hypothetical protein